MKNKIAFESFDSRLALSSEELILVNGGEITKETSIFEDIAFVLGRTARCIWEFSKTGVEYQHSLPANLKK